MKKVAFFEEMTYPEDFEYSSIIYYINILMRSANVSAMLINNLYAPPPAQKKLVIHLT